MQHTLRRAVRASGIGLHTGCQVSIEICPAPVDTGIVFRRVDLQGFEIEARRRWVSRVVLATTLMKKGVMLSTIEHLISALYGCQVDNAYIDIDSLEVPILDGSARPFVEMIERAGLEPQDAERTYLVVQEPLRLEEAGKFIAVEPHPSFHVRYEIDFTHPVIGNQVVDLEITPESYSREIAFSRTFGFYAEVEDLLRKGLIRGGSLDNAIVLGEHGIMSGELRAPDEFVRHKALDLIGDIALCGYPVLGKVSAYKAGHALHTNLATELSRPSGVARRMTESALSGLLTAVNQ